MRRSSAAIAGALICASCSATPLTQLVVIVDTDLEPVDQVERVVISVTEPGSTEPTLRAAIVDGPEDLPLTLPLVHRGGPLGPIEVHAAALVGTTEVVARDATVTMIERRTVVLELHLERACVAVDCDEAAGETCEHGACRARAIDPAELRDFDGTVPRLTSDGGRGDGAECLATELCNRVDDDCDGMVDEGITDTDPRNCGECGNVCPDYDNAVAACAMGECTIRCTEGFGDCDGTPLTGCEEMLSSLTRCGACDNECDVPHGTPRCFMSACSVVGCSPGWDDCDGVAEGGCEQPLDDLAHCGACDAPCAPAHATGSCAGGVCAVLDCEAGYASCDGGDADGCETSLATVANCGACGRTCGAIAGGTVACEAGSCVVGACDSGRADCNASLADGCETPLGTVADCGACGDACELAHATERCAAGGCEIEACDPGWGDCDGIGATGCETPLDNATSCGACGRACTSPTPLCSEGAVGILDCRSACAAGETTCGTGCVDTRTSLSHCGACDSPCAPARATPICSASVCGVASCDSGWADCNGMAADGCERAVVTVSDCGACGRSCTLPAAIPMCAGGECAIAACIRGYDDCDGDPSNGCETPLDTLSDCGTCGSACALDRATASCATGSCEIVACASGYDDCNGNDADGCETPLTTLTDCGTCGAACDVPRATETCATGVCARSVCDPGYADCDGVLATGCETSTLLVTSCGSCAACPDLARATEGCSASGACEIAACDAGFEDCDRMPANGCEAELATSTMHCGACGRACRAGEYCGSGTCVNPRAVVQISAGFDFTCARIADGRVYCWGGGSSGQLGRGSTSGSNTAGAVMTITDAIDLEAGSFHACVVRTGGSVWCWGENASRQLGDGSTTDRTTPVAVMGLTDAVQVSAGSGHTCAVRATGAVSCWGENSSGQLGGSTGAARSMPMDVATITGAVNVGAGTSHTCTVLATGAVMCWGANGNRQLGVGGGGTSATPVRVGTIADATRVSTRADFNCMQRPGAISCWGENGDGQLADGSTTDRSAPVTVPGLSMPVQPAAGGQHACARLASGSVMCWGANGGGQLGNGSTSMSTAPVAVTGLTTAIDVTGGADHTCAARADGTAVCWGTGASGRLGNGGTGDQRTPVAVMGLP